MTSHMQTHAVTVSLTWSMVRIHTNKAKCVHTLTYAQMQWLTVRVSQRADAEVMYGEGSSGNVLSVETHSLYAYTHTHTHRHYRYHWLEREKSGKNADEAQMITPPFLSFSFSSPTLPSCCSFFLFIVLSFLLSFLATGRLPPRGYLKWFSTQTAVFTTFPAL